MVSKIPEWVLDTFRFTIGRARVHPTNYMSLGGMATHPAMIGHGTHLFLSIIVFWILAPLASSLAYFFDIFSFRTMLHTSLQTEVLFMVLSAFCLFIPIIWPFVMAEINWHLYKKRNPGRVKRNNSMFNLIGPEEYVVDVSTIQHKLEAPV